MGLEEAKERLLELARISEEGAKLHPEDSEMFLTDKEAIETVIAELHAMQNLLDEKNEEIELLQKENERYENKIILSDEEYRRVIDAAQKDCVSKDKIREKIKEIYEDKFNKYYDMFLEQRDIEKTIGILKDLLKEE